MYLFLQQKQNSVAIKMAIIKRKLKIKKLKKYSLKR
jgi:hypothetical protein